MELDFYRQFGFVVLKNWFSPDEVKRLQAEIEFALQDGFGELYDTRDGEAGDTGHFLPMMSDLTPFSASLVSDDLRLTELAGELLGGPVLPNHAEGILFFDQTPWHFDENVVKDSVKYLTYFPPLTADTGALRLLPGSHLRPPQELEAYRNQQFARWGEKNFKEFIESFPGYVAESRPGDLIAFSGKTWHASYGGKDRLAWSLEYILEPTGSQEKKITLEWLAESCDLSSLTYDSARYPFYRDWRANRPGNLNREITISRLENLGLFNLPID